MTTDIFHFWWEIGRPRAGVHPADRAVFSRVDHGFDLKCIPICFYGPLLTAPVVLLYLSPGWRSDDPIIAKNRKYRDFHARTRKGCAPLPESDVYLPWHRWCKERVELFGDWDKLKCKVAVLNIAAYHSKEFKDYPLLAVLPSSRVSLEWAQNVLFPQAEAGDRTVVCLSATEYWGLKVGQRYGHSLFAPPVTRGRMNLDDMRGEVIRAVQRALRIQPATASKPNGDKDETRRRRGSGLTFPLTAKVTRVQTPNPKREGTRGWRWYNLYRAGIAVAELLNLGVSMADIRWNLGHDFISLAPPPIHGPPRNG
jgi:hypothetical protein